METGYRARSTGASCNTQGSVISTGGASFVMCGKNGNRNKELQTFFHFDGGRCGVNHGCFIQKEIFFEQFLT